jgi:bifunctional non-homologous end joining protein LigD
VPGRAGRLQFNALLFRRGTPVFVAFDMLAENDRDLRALPLVRRKARLRRVIPLGSTCALYAEHVARAGRALFAEVCVRDRHELIG